MAYQLDFEQVALAGRQSRHRPTLPARQLTPAQLNSEVVQPRLRYHHEAWHLPLYDAYVRTWLKQQQFAEPPFISVSGVEVVCGKELAT